MESEIIPNNMLNEKINDFIIKDEFKSSPDNLKKAFLNIFKSFENISNTYKNKINELEYCKSFVNLTSDAIFFINKKFDVVKSNSAFDNLFFGQNFNELLNIIQQDTLKSTVLECFNSNENNFEIKFIDKYNSKLYYFNAKCNFYNAQYSEPLVLISLSDITKAKNFEIELYEKNKLIKAAFDSSFDSFFLFDLDYKIIFFNKQAQNYAKTYWKKKLKKGQSMQDFAKPFGVWDLFKDLFSKAVNGEQVSNEQLITDGEKFNKWFYSSFAPVYSQNNQVIAVSFSTSDITEKKDAQIALQKSEATARAFLKSKVDAIALFDDKLNFIDLNQTMADNFNNTIENLKGCNPFSIMNQQIAHTRIKKISKIFETGIEQRWEDQRNGIWFDNAVFPIKNIDGGIHSVALIARNITKLKNTENALLESEEKFKSLVSNSTDAIRMIDENGIIIFCNDAHYALTGYSATEVEGQTIWSFLEKSMQFSSLTQKFVQNFKNNIINKKQIKLNSPFYGRIINKFGGVIDVQFSVFEIDDGQKIRYGNIIRNITDLKKKEKELQELVATKDKFFNIIAHDLISPFNAILGFTEILKYNEEQSENSNNIKIINSLHQSAKNAFNLVENLLQWSRTQTGKMKYEPKNHSISEIITNIIASIEAAANAKKINLVSHVNDFAVFVDKNMIEVVIRNLLSNAIKFTQEKGIVAITASIIKKAAIVSIIDNGVGIEQKRINSIFSIDKEYTTTGTNYETGTGLGLVLCKEFVLKNRGKIWVESKQNLGSTFSFSMPLAFKRPVV
ncbi:MAG: PAS domain S-box protein [Bacteroidales bacterium]|nr:PAS domain S-box protein [Bacteroidales bacterium]